jgi:pimeloyl-ACP methyl ester carboxylesterase
MFYAFRAAETAPEDAPLLVVFNGGPGVATTDELLANGTGPYHVETADDGTSHVVPNPGSLTRFANVLWVDQRLTGFSYAKSKSDRLGSFHPLDDAADFVRVMLGFIEAHPRLARARVGIVGESYGGARALAMLHEVLHAGDSLGAELGLREPVTRWLGGEPTPERIAGRMRGLVLIQPLVLGSLQMSAQADESARMLRDYLGQDPYDVRRQDNSNVDPLATRAALEAFARPDDCFALFGVDIAATPGLGPSARIGAARMPDGSKIRAVTQFEEVLTARLGPLQAGDSYFDDDFVPIQPADRFRNVDPNFFIEALRTAPVFITDAKFDAIIRSHVIFDVLATAGFPVDESARPGHRVVTLPATETAPSRTVAIRFPAYDAGHMVPATQPVAFANDVREWLEESAGVR